MGVLSTNRAQITSGGLISASFISDVYDVLTGTTPDTTVFSGSLSVSGSLNVSTTITGSFTGSLVGQVTGTCTTASYVAVGNIDGTVANATSASYVTTAVSASYATTAVTSSFVSSTLTFGTGSSLTTAVNGMLAVSSSGDLYFASASSWYKVTLG